MHIDFPPPRNKATAGTAAADSLPANREAAPAAPSSQQVAASVSPTDAQIIHTAEAALKASVETDARINEIREAVQAGRVRFDAEALAAHILRFHGRRG